jgi:hypothetical protein
MGTYRQPAIIDQSAGLKQANAEISKFNDDLGSLYGPQATAEDGEDGKDGLNFKTLQAQNNQILDELDLFRAQQNQSQIADLKKPSAPNAFLQQLGMDAKDKYLKHVAEGNKFAANSMLKLADGLKGTMTGLNNMKNELTASLDVPRGGPKSINAHLIDNDIFKMGKSLVMDPEFKNFEASLNEDGTSLEFGLKGQPKFDMNKFNANLMSPNGVSLIQTNGDMADVTKNMAAGGENKQTIVEKVFETKGIKPNEQGIITFEDGNNVLDEIANYDQEAVLNNQDYSTSIYPQVLDQTLAVYNEVKDKDGNSLDPIQSQIKNLWDNNPYGMKDPVNDYKKNGSEIIGNYVGAQVAVNRQNSPEVIFDRKIVQLGLNEAYAREFARPIIETKPEVEAEVLDMTTADGKRKANKLDRKKDDIPLEEKLKQMTESDRNQLASQNFNKTMESDDLNNRQMNNLMNATSSSEIGKSGQSYSLYNPVNKIGE